MKGLMLPPAQHRPITHIFCGTVNREGKMGMEMRIAFPVHDHRGLDDEIFEHFGHAPAFLLVDVRETP